MRLTRRELVRAAVPLAGGLALVGSWGCRDQAPQSGGPQAKGAESTTPRVVSVSPNTTETLFAVGAGELVVGRSRYCDFPPEAARLPVVGGFSDPSFEAIVALRPTLAVGDRGPAGPELERRLRAQGIDTYFPPIRSVAEVHAMITGMGQRLMRSAEAARLNERIRGEIQRIASAAAATQPPLRAVLVFDLSPIVVAGPTGYAAELLALAGAQNAITRGGLYPTVGIEHLLALDPDVVLDASVTGTGESARGTAAPTALPERPGWNELRAVRQGRVGVLRSSAALRPGPRLAEGLGEIARELRTGTHARPQPPPERPHAGGARAEG